MTNHAVEKDIDLIPTTPGEVAKALVYIALSAVGVLQLAISDNDISLSELLNTIIIVVGLVPVYLLAGRWPKTIAAFLAALAQAIVVLLVNGATAFSDLSISDWMGVIIAAFAAIGILIVPNGSKIGPMAVVPTPTPQAAQVVQDQIEHRKVEPDQHIIS